ncbi:hypothetical protein C8255_04275 [filamentous cyanobacterium CCP3]|nr:hypothetical protein C8255_04275 [filamentous cyanobacterium CCP3]
MPGELRGDITRDTYSPQKQFLRVLMQQGRVQVDADFNEQVSILLNYLQTLATDLIGPYGVPAMAPGFEIGLQTDSPSNGLSNLTIGPGRYYLEGLLCENLPVSENGAPITFEKQPYFSPPAKANHPYPDLPFLVYLDVWEQHIDPVQDGGSHGPSIREVALGGPDTAARSKVIWQVRHTQKLTPNSNDDLQEIFNSVVPAPVQNPPDGGVPAPGEPNGQPGEEEASTSDSQLAELVKAVAEHLRTQPQTGQTLLHRLIGHTDNAVPRLRARAARNSTSTPHDPCTVAPDARYRGAENQLYRVEIHTGSDNGANPTFKWSRENSAVVFPLASAPGQVVTLEHLGYDSRFSLKEGDWVEVIDDAYIYRNEPKPLLQVKKIDLITLQVTLSAPPEGATGSDRSLHPALRRWDHQAGNSGLGGSVLASDGTIPIAEDDRWQTLENGVQVQFLLGTYRPGDYWLIPARTATGDVEWPQTRQDGKYEPQALPPHGVKHYYAPLALIAKDENGDIQAVDCRRQFAPLPPAPADPDPEV